MAFYGFLTAQCGSVPFYHTAPHRTYEVGLHCTVGFSPTYIFYLS